MCFGKRVYANVSTVLRGGLPSFTSHEAQGSSRMWNRGAECLPRRELEQLQLERLRSLVERVRRAVQALPAERITVNPDCGCVHLPTAVAFGKLRAMVEGTHIVRRELQGWI